VSEIARESIIITRDAVDRCGRFFNVLQASWHAHLRRLWKAFRGRIQCGYHGWNLRTRRWPDRSSGTRRMDFAAKTIRLNRIHAEVWMDTSSSTSARILRAGQSVWKISGKIPALANG